MAGLSKSKIQVHRQCPKRLWLQVNQPDLAREDESTQARFATGHLVGQIARSLYPDGILVDEENLQLSLKQTREYLASENRPLFEATFQAEGVLVRADLLLPDREGYRMVEVKSSASVKDYQVEDAAIQAWVARLAGVPLTSIEVAHVNNQFVYPGDGDYHGLLAYQEVTAGADALQGQVPAWILAARNTLEGPEPEMVVGKQCGTPFACPFLSYCAPEGLEDKSRYPVEILYRAGRLADELRSEGYEDIRAVPAGRLTKPVHWRMWRVSRSGLAELDPAAGMELEKLGYPRYYLDFETLAMAVPVWTGTRPFQAIPFQWSCHVEMRGGVIEHREFLASGTVDPSREFAETLVAALGNNGPILVYNAGTERSHMQNLAARFPDLASALEAASRRIVDLLPIARAHYYHPEMRGSWSIKDVLPTIAPELAYEGMDVADGMAAQLAFSELMEPTTLLARREQIRTSLLEYCERDTLAMLRIAHYFEGSK